MRHPKKSHKRVMIQQEKKNGEKVMIAVYVKVDKHGLPVRGD